jgi:hypothetical protein
LDRRFHFILLGLVLSVFGCQAYERHEAVLFQEAAKGWVGYFGEPDWIGLNEGIILGWDNGVYVQFLENDGGWYTAYFFQVMERFDLEEYQRFLVETLEDLYGLHGTIPATGE